jgi:hypothetical protein
MRNVKLNITDATGATISIAKDPSRDELIIRNGETSDKVWLAFNEDAVADQGLYLSAGDAIVLNSSKKDRKTRCTADVYMVCGAGETASVYADITS